MLQERIHRTKFSFVFGAADTRVALPLIMEGGIRHFHLRVPAGITATLTVEDEEGYEVYNSTAQVGGIPGLNVTLQPPNDVVLVAGPCSLVVTLSGAPGEPGTEVIAVPWLFGQKIG